MKNHTNKENKYDYDLVVIGGGPAGMTAAIYAQRANLKTVIIEKYIVGGKMIKTSEIENYPGYDYILGPELSEKMQKQVEKLQVEFVTDEVIKITDSENHKIKTVLLSSGDVLIAKGVIIATGSLERKIGVPGEEEYANRGVSYCAVCDGALFKNKIISVVGGGYAACEESLYLTRFTNKVNLIHRRDQFRADDKTVNKVKNNENINLITDHVVLKVLGTEDKKKVGKLEIQNIKTKEISEITTDALFPYIGSDPVTKFVKDLDICDSNGYIIVNDKCQTKIPGLYAAGDVIAKNLRQIVTAVNDGAIAAQYLINFIDNFNE
ncbi:MAG: thioredoxin-disulfide reductase [Spiroplasma sp. WSS]|uniref:Thioredoxin reductase n=1 Tax=Spiroplasma ixodetis TaxID=2141 RepID=A0ABM8BSQ9_9MOLU|nr:MULTISPECIES: thioredoxin-disulfide reductase [Spiroplasma]TLF27236.1 MAG: thioredoxin-disulfide reductase [Spiroplasma sp. WSS]BDT02896.1 thioredoxin-disulfide reductase [Spiroplasma ixodetis]